MDEDRGSPSLHVMSRRGFLTTAAAVGISAFLYSYTSQVVSALESANTRLVWLRGSGCGGCTGSFLNGGNPDVLTAISRLKLDIVYHEGIMPQQGIFINGIAENTGQYNSSIRLRETLENERYILVVEGAIPNGPDGSGKYCMSGGRPLKDIFAEAAKNAEHIVAVGTCASYGGMARAAGSEMIDARGVSFTGTSRLNGIMAEMGISGTVINIPGCPPHPDWILLALADLMSGNEVEVDMYRRPVAFFGNSTVHDSCPRRGRYDRADRDTTFASGGCLYNLGCKGQITSADCSIRKWNEGVSMCTQSGGPCIACVEPEFPDAFSPFFNRSESRDILSGVDVDMGAKVILGAAAIGTGIHAVKRLAIGENDHEEIEIPGENKKSKRRL